MDINLGPFTISVDEIAALARRAHQRMRRRRRGFSDYFEVIGDPAIDYCVYQLGLRPLMPLIEILYFEYLNFLLRNDLVRKLIISPSVDLSQPVQDAGAFRLLKQRLELILGNYNGRFRLIDPLEQRAILSSVSLLSPDFLELVQYVGSGSFLSYIRNQLGLDVQSYAEFNRFHPEELRLVSVLVHLIQGYVVWQNLLSQELADINEDFNLGLLVWETGVDKLGLFHRLAVDRQSISLTVLLGKTCMIKRNTPLPAFDSEESINLFDGIPETCRKLSRLNRPEVSVYEDILLTILLSNYEFAEPEDQEIERFVKGLSLNYPPSKTALPTRQASRVLYYTSVLKGFYGKR